MWRPVPQPLPTPGAGSCSVAPVSVHAGSNNCLLGQNLGCFVGEQKMWLIAPCQGAFLCNGRYSARHQECLRGRDAGIIAPAMNMKLHYRRKQAAKCLLG